MLATQSTDLQDLHTIDAGGFSATVDAFARDETTDGLWFLSMVGSQTALKAIWASLLKQPPDVAHLIRAPTACLSLEATSGARCPTTPSAPGRRRSPGCPCPGVGMPSCIPKWRSSPSSETPSSSWPSRRRRLPALHQRFLDRRSPLPLHNSWAGWLWQRGIEDCGEIVPLFRPSEFRPTGAPPMPKGSGMTSPAPWRRDGLPYPIKIPDRLRLQRAAHAVLPGRAIHRPSSWPYKSKKRGGKR